MDMKKYETEKIVLVMRDGTLPHSFQRDSGIRRLTPYHGLLSLYCRGERGEKKTEDALLLCYTLERQLLLAFVVLATAQRLMGFFVLFLL